MSTFSNDIKLIPLIWLMITLSAVNCKENIVKLNCTITYPSDSNETNDSQIETPTINSCPESYKNKSIIRKCEHLINKDRPLDSELFMPITNNVTKVTYWNKYCATCNNDNETSWEMWLSWPYSRSNEELCDNLLTRIQRSEIDDLPELLKIFIDQGGLKLKYRFLGERKMQCSTEGNWPIHLIQDSVSCLLNEFQVGQLIRFLPCQYAGKNGGICTRMRLYLDGLGFTFEDGRGQRINFNETLSDFKFTSDQYTVETSYDGVFYICEKATEIYGTGHGAKIIICIISLIFIFAYLGINFNKQYFHNTANKMLYLCMAGLIVIGAILLLVYLSYPVSCVAFYLAKFLWFYHFFWTLLIFLEYCTKYHCVCDDCIKSDNGLSRLKNYSFYIYSFLGLVIPLVLPITYYYGVLVIDENYKEDMSQINPYARRIKETEYPCPVVPDHSGISCTPYRDSGSEYYLSKVEDILSQSFSFFIPVLFVLLSAFGVNHFIKICGSEDEPSTDTTKRDHIVVLIKMAIIMGIHWILYKVYVKYGNNYSSKLVGLSLDTICQFSIDFHGVIVVIVLGIEAFMDKLGYGFNFKSVSQQNGNQMETTRQSYPLSAQ